MARAGTLLAGVAATSLRARLAEAPGSPTPATTSGKPPSAVSSTQPVQSPSGASEKIFARHFRQTLITLAIGHEFHEFRPIDHQRITLAPGRRRCFRSRDRHATGPKTAAA